VHAYPQEGIAIDLTMPSLPYEAFAIRSFSIFNDAASGKVQRDAYVMMSHACPYHCNSCSEAAQIRGRTRAFPQDHFRHDRV
jgi:hypothetical protein